MRDARGRIMRGDTETGRAGGSALKRRNEALRVENARLRAALEWVKQVLAEHDAGLPYPETVGKVRGILGRLADEERRLTP